MTIYADNMRELVRNETECATVDNDAEKPFCMDSRGLRAWSYKLWESARLPFIAGTSSLDQFTNGRAVRSLGVQFKLFVYPDVLVDENVQCRNGCTFNPQKHPFRSVMINGIFSSVFAACGVAGQHTDDIAIKRLQQHADAAGNPAFPGKIAHRCTLYIRASHRVGQSD